MIGYFFQNRFYSIKEVKKILKYLEAQEKELNKNLKEIEDERKIN